MDLPEILELFLNTLEFLALITSVTTFLILMFNKFASGLKYIFAPCGLGFFRRLSVLFICRQSYIKKRAFIEFALLKTQGRPVISSEWKTIINEFKGFYNENSGNLVYSIPNCTLLIGDNLSNAIGRYFAFLNKPKVKQAFGIKDERLTWVINIHIEEAYATPTCLLTGLLAKYEENWEEFIKKYVSTAYITEAETDFERCILPGELYLTFAWLLWGPSYELEYRKYWAGLCQLSYGDESNSLPAIVNRDTDALSQLRDKFESNEGKRYGALMSVDLSVFEKKTYYRNIREFEHPQNVYFYDKVKGDDCSFAIQIDNFVPCENYKSQKYYCTAYVWLLFELDDCETLDFHPEKTVAFFEHANLTDKHTYNFLISTLIDKSVKHFEDIFNDEKYCKRKYRFVAALNNVVEEKFKARYTEIIKAGDERSKKFAAGIALDSKRTPAMAFSAFDEYFAQSNGQEFVEVSLNNKSSISDLGNFYTNVFIDCFPNADERETFDNFLKYLQLAKENKEYEYHILLMEDNDKVVGGAVFDYFKRTNSAVIEFLAIKSELQSSGLGTELLKRVQLILSRDANKQKKLDVDNIFCEIDSPEYSTANIKKYLYFWNKNNFKHIDFNYVQPALSVGQNHVEGLWFAVLSKKGDKAISVELLKNVLYDYMKYCMQIDNPETNDEYVSMCSNLADKQYVSFSKIID